MCGVTILAKHCVACGRHHTATPTPPRPLKNPLRVSLCAVRENAETLDADDKPLALAVTHQLTHQPTQSTPPPDVHHAHRAVTKPLARQQHRAATSCVSTSCGLWCG